MVDFKKVEQRREEAIQSAVLTNDWVRVDKLLSQAFENLLRKDRSYGLCSLDSRYVDTGSLLDTIADYNDPLPLLSMISIICSFVFKFWTVLVNDSYEVK